MSDADSRQLATLLEQAERHRRAHDWRGAMELLKRALALDPEHAVAHAMLALTLLGARRLAGAGVEADLAIGFGSDSAFCHYAAAQVRRAERKLGDAWRHCQIALDHDPQDVDARVLGANIRTLQGDAPAARALLDDALAIAPDRAAVLVALARWELRAGNLDEAQRWSERALTAEPASADAHIAAGYIDLRRGEVDSAEQHARFALGVDATDFDGLQLWTAVKARRSLVLGLWYRFNAMLTLRSERSQLGVIIGTFVAVRLAIIVANALGLDGVATLLGYAWFGFCAYTWVAPELFRQWLKRELSSVTLRDDY